MLEALWKHRPATPWICITGHADRDAVFKEVPSERVLLKPFGISALDEQIRRWSGGRSSARDGGNLRDGGVNLPVED